MPIYKGDAKIENIEINGKSIKSVYKGNSLVYSKPLYELRRITVWEESDLYIPDSELTTGMVNYDNNTFFTYEAIETYLNENPDLGRLPTYDEWSTFVSDYYKTHGSYAVYYNIENKEIEVGKYTFSHPGVMFTLSGTGYNSMAYKAVNRRVLAEDKSVSKSTKGIYIDCKTTGGVDMYTLSLTGTVPNGTPVQVRLVKDEYIRVPLK